MKIKLTTARTLEIIPSKPPKKKGSAPQKPTAQSQSQKTNIIINNK